MASDIGTDEPFISLHKPSRTKNSVSTRKTVTQVHVTALDAVVSVNSLFTIAVFLGLSFTSQISEGLPSNCTPGVDTIKYLLVFEVVSFGFYLFSSLVAYGLKLHILFCQSSTNEAHLPAHLVEVNRRFLRYGVTACAVGSVVGSLFLLLSILSIIQLRLGKFSCGHGNWAERAGIPLIITIVTGGIFFLSSLSYAALVR